MKTIYFMLFFAAIQTAVAMDFWPALSMQESNDNDLAVGPAGEVSRYQILPSVWRDATNTTRFVSLATGLPVKMDPRNPSQAYEVAMTIECNRAVAIHRSYLDLSPMEKALLWKCPSRMNHPTKQKLDQAKRVVNLIESK